MTIDPDVRSVIRMGACFASVLVLWAWIVLTMLMWNLPPDDSDPTLVQVLHNQVEFVEHKLKRIY